MKLRISVNISIDGRSSGTAVEVAGDQIGLDNLSSTLNTMIIQANKSVIDNERANMIEHDTSDDPADNGEWKL